MHFRSSIVWKTTSTGIVVLVVYADDILSTNSNMANIFVTKVYFCQHLVMCDLKTLYYFFVIGFTYQLGKHVPFQRMYVKCILKEKGLLDCRDQ